jgi:myosin heavy subunit
VEFKSNQYIIDTIQGSEGVLGQLDDECKLPKGDDGKWVRKMYQVRRRHPDLAGRRGGSGGPPPTTTALARFKPTKSKQHRCSQSFNPPPPQFFIDKHTEANNNNPQGVFKATNRQQRDGTFTITHFAGDVEYTALGFVEKNKDSTLAGVGNLWEEGKCEKFFSEVMGAGEEEVKEEGAGGGKRTSSATISGKVRGRARAPTTPLDDSHPFFRSSRGRSRRC